MLSRLRSQLPVLITAILVSTVFATGPTVAQAAFDAVNADKVDGKHAVGAGATTAARKGKLVATSPTTGRLPNNIIAKAADSGLLDGLDSTAFSRTTHNHDAAYAPATHNHDAAYAPAGHNHDSAYVKKNTAIGVRVMSIRGDASVRHQSDPAATVNRLSTGVYCINAPGTQEGAVGVLQSTGGTEGTIRVSMGIVNACSAPFPGADMIVETFTGTTPSDQRFAVMYPVAIS